MFYFCIWTICVIRATFCTPAFRFLFFSFFIRPCYSLCTFSAWALWGCAISLVCGSAVFPLPSDVCGCFVWLSLGSGCWSWQNLSEAPSVSNWTVTVLTLLSSRYDVPPEMESDLKLRTVFRIVCKPCVPCVSSRGPRWSSVLRDRCAPKAYYYANRPADTKAEDSFEFVRTLDRNTLLVSELCTCLLPGLASLDSSGPVLRCALILFM